DRAARCTDPAGQRGLGHEPVIPHRVKQLVLADNPVTMLDEVDQQIEHLRLDVDGLARAPQFSAVDVYFAISEPEDHGGTPEPTSFGDGRFRQIPRNSMCRASSHPPAAKMPSAARKPPSTKQ